MANAHQLNRADTLPAALAAGERGLVKFRVEIDEKGNVRSCKVTASSGYKRLDDETCNLIVEHARFKPVLDSEGKAREGLHHGMVNWRIPGAAAGTQGRQCHGQSARQGHLQARPEDGLARVAFPRVHDRARTGSAG